jgi:two-component system NarL family response regulator
MPTRIAIAEDQRIVRDMLGALLEREADLELVGSVGTGAQAIALAAEQHPDVLVLDIGLPDLDGVEVTRRIKEEISPAPKVLALSMHDSRFFVQQMLRAGADGYVVKSAALPELVQAIRVVASGRLYLSPDIARQALGPASLEEGTALGSRERQVLALLAQGKRSSDIAGDLHISVATVEAHRRNIMRKLDLHTVAELTKYAIRAGLTSL